MHFLGICVGLSVNRSNKMVMITWSASIKSSTSGKHCPVTPTASEHRWESTMKTTESSSPHPAAVRHSVSLEPVKCNTLILNDISALASRDADLNPSWINMTRILTPKTQAFYSIVSEFISVVGHTTLVIVSAIKLKKRTEGDTDCCICHMHVRGY